MRGLRGEFGGCAVPERRDEAQHYYRRWTLLCVSVVAVERLGFREEECRAAHRVRAIGLSGGIVVEGARAP